MKFSEFETNKQLETEGVTVDMGDGFSVRIARANNENVKKMFRKITKPYARQMRNDTMSDDKASELLARCYSKHVLLGWEGLTEEDGTPIEYSNEKAFELLTRSEDFFEAIRELASERATFQTEDKETSEKN